MTNEFAKRMLASRLAVPESDVRLLLREAIDSHYPSMRAAGRQWGVSAAYLSDILSGRRPPGPTILKILGLKRHRYVKIEYTAITPSAYRPARDELLYQEQEDHIRRASEHKQWCPSWKNTGGTTNGYCTCRAEDREGV